MEIPIGSTTPADLAPQQGICWKKGNTLGWNQRFVAGLCFHHTVQFMIGNVAGVGQAFGVASV
jgi:hypothetical protein